MTSVLCAIEVNGRPSLDGELVIRVLHLNEDPALSERLYRLEVLALKQEFPEHERVSHCLAGRQQHRAGEE